MDSMKGLTFFNQFVLAHQASVRDSGVLIPISFMHMRRRKWRVLTVNYRPAENYVVAQVNYTVKSAQGPKNCYVIGEIS